MIPTTWTKQAMIIGFKFERESFWYLFELFEHMGVAENFYKGSIEPSKNKLSGVDDNRTSDLISKGG